MTKVRQPNPIKVFGYYLYPYNVDLETAKKLHSWLERVIKWRELR